MKPGSAAGPLHLLFTLPGTHCPGCCPLPFGSLPAASSGGLSSVPSLAPAPTLCAELSLVHSLSPAHRPHLSWPRAQTCLVWRLPRVRLGSASVTCPRGHSTEALHLPAWAAHPLTGGGPPSVPTLGLCSHCISEPTLALVPALSGASASGSPGLPQPDASSRKAPSPAPLQAGSSPGSHTSIPCGQGQEGGHTLGSDTTALPLQLQDPHPGWAGQAH